MPEETKKKKWWQSRKIQIALVTAIYELILGIIAGRVSPDTAELVKTLMQYGLAIGLTIIGTHTLTDNMAILKSSKN